MDYIGILKDSKYNSSENVILYGLKILTSHIFLLYLSSAKL